MRNHLLLLAVVPVLGAGVACGGSGGDGNGKPADCLGDEVEPAPDTPDAVDVPVDTRVDLPVDLVADVPADGPPDAPPDVPDEGPVDYGTPPDIPPDGLSATTTYHLDPASLRFFGLPINSSRFGVGGLDVASRTCLSVIWDFSNTGHGLGSGVCGGFGAGFPYLVVTTDTDGPCDQWGYAGLPFLSGDGCADWAGLGGGHADLADFDATFLAGTSGIRVVADTRGEAWPRSVSLGLRFGSDIPEHAYVQSGDAYGLPGWVSIRKGDEGKVLWDRCDVPVCGQSTGVCGQALPQVQDLTGGYTWTGAAWVTWDGRFRVLDEANQCWKHVAADPGEYTARFCLGFQVEGEYPGQTVVNPTCFDVPFTLPADQVVGNFSNGG